MRRIPAVEDEAFVGASATLHRRDRDVLERRRGGEEPFWMVQPTLSAVETDRGDDFLGDPFESLRIAERPMHPQADKHDLIAQRVRGESESRPRQRKLAGLAADIVSPRLGVVTAGLSERADDGSYYAGPWTTPIRNASRILLSVIASFRFCHTERR